eukprot:TRINITY_DN865_c0_g1_i2.p1 TRINITY_DN865_c0_g1~~TRINITY_DN865_c0_g1_i2.p1  ORF type:complete len:176 (-),score=6.31 TRINITY_DN865_c0_g1_i2:212-739(-)
MNRLLSSSANFRNFALEQSSFLNSLTDLAVLSETADGNVISETLQRQTRSLVEDWHHLFGAGFTSLFDRLCIAGACLSNSSRSSTPPPPSLCIDHCNYPSTCDTEHAEPSTTTATGTPLCTELDSTELVALMRTLTKTDLLRQLRARSPTNSYAAYRRRPRSFHSGEYVAWHSDS